MRKGITQPGRVLGNRKPLFTAHSLVPPRSPPGPTPRYREPSPTAPARQRPALQAQTGRGPGDGQLARLGLLKRLLQKLLQRCKRCGGAAETGAHAGIASTSERRGHTRAGVQHASNHRRCERGLQAEDQTRAAGTPQPA